jgi:predicted tellurium resistance membrane protein TerC
MGAILESFQSILQNPLDALVALIFLSVMEIVLGIDNIVFISILTGRLPPDEQPRARKLGLSLALIMRIVLLLMVSWLLGLKEPFLHLTGLEPILGWFSENPEQQKEIMEVSWKDLILLAGGLFLIWKATVEIHREMAGEEEGAREAKGGGFGAVIAQIVVMDLVFSIDSVLTAVGMTKEIAVMIVAVILAIGVMMVSANSVAHFVHKHPTLKMLALSFLVLIGVMLTAEGSGFHLPKGYIYFAMTFSVLVEMLNMRLRLRKLRTKEELAGEH